MFIQEQQDNAFLSEYGLPDVRSTVEFYDYELNDYNYGIVELIHGGYTDGDVDGERYYPYSVQVQTPFGYTVVKLDELDNVTDTDGNITHYEDY